MKINESNCINLCCFICNCLICYFPQFEREDFNPENVEKISIGEMKTSTTLKSETTENNDLENDQTNESDFADNVYDALLINNQSKRIDNIFQSYLIIGSDQRTASSSASRGFIAGSRADVIMLV